jgi:type I site-specific restriction endonuclease
VGLTATPKDEVDRNTYSLFDLENGVPTDAYSLDEAVHDGFLVPPKAVSVPLKFQREGIKYDELSEDDKEQWDALEWDEDGASPIAVEAEAVNKWLFNKDTVDKVLEHLMTRGLTRWPAATGSARPSSSPRTSATPSSSPSASTPTTRTTRASSRASSRSRPSTRRA